MSPTAGVEKKPFFNNLHPGGEKKNYILSEKYEKFIWETFNASHI